MVQFGRCARPAMWAHFFCFLLTLTTLVPAARAQKDDDREEKLYNSIKWQTGPATTHLGNIAEIKIPKGYQFADREGAQIWDELTQNPPDDSVLGIITPANRP